MDFVLCYELAQFYVAPTCKFDTVEPVKKDTLNRGNLSNEDTGVPTICVQIYL